MRKGIAIVVVAVGIASLVGIGYIANYRDYKAKEGAQEQLLRVLSRVHALQVESEFHRSVIAGMSGDLKLAEAEREACERREGDALVRLGDANDQLDFLRERLRVKAADLEAVLARLRTREADYVCALEALDGTPEPECWRPEFRTAREGL